MKKVLASTALIATLLAGCTTEVETVGPDKTTVNKPAEQQQQQAKVYKLGETVKVDGLEIQITSAKYTKPAEYGPAKNGKVLTLEVATSNTGQTQALVDNVAFNLYDKDGNKMEPYFSYDEMAITGQVNAGKKLNGKLYYDVKEGEKFELVYVPMLSMDQKEIKFEIIPSK
ncbi:DUF4352 domain-containing protein [Risungbinella massiliensis]|uniref:DUF4352 domain-containing protein n=1 Tax=Risungbinella massiliensis TaxID=1329796 RepID=UPI0005CC657E|nr:DUF4352 domain-containing protein [Risungbinella massiliensis]